MSAILPVIDPIVADPVTLAGLFVLVLMVGIAIGLKLSEAPHD